VQVSTCLVDAYEVYNCFGEVSFVVVPKASKWNKEQPNERKRLQKGLKCLKVRTVKNAYLEQLCLNGMKGSEKGESRYRMMNGKTVFQHAEWKSRQ
jgi:hypothetical protein